MSNAACKKQLRFSFAGKQEVVADFEGGRITSDAGLVLFRQLDERIGLTERLSGVLEDPRWQPLVRHHRRAIVRQRLYGIVAGYEDGNDARYLRGDPVMQLVCGGRSEGDALASQSTISRFENALTRRQWEIPEQERPAFYEQQAARLSRVEAMNDVLLEIFIATRKEAPKRMVLDMDPSDDPTHGHQQLTLFHGYYDQSMYFPLFLYDSESGYLLSASLRPGAVHASCGAVDDLSRVVAKLRKAYPGIEIALRFDSGGAMPENYEYCEGEGILYWIGLPANDVLVRASDDLLEEAQRRFDATGQKQRLFTTFWYRAETWSHARRVVAKAEVQKLPNGSVGTNRRFVVTNDWLTGTEAVYDEYVKRGRVENHIDEFKNDLHFDRLSCHRFLANAFRLLLHAAAYNLVVLLREAGACVAAVAGARISTLRTQLIKVGARVRTTTRRIWLHLATGWPFAPLFVQVAAALDTG